MFWGEFRNCVVIAQFVHQKAVVSSFFFQTVKCQAQGIVVTVRNLGTYIKNVCVCYVLMKSNKPWLIYCYHIICTLRYQSLPRKSQILWIHKRNFLIYKRLNNFNSEMPNTQREHRVLVSGTTQSFTLKVGNICTL